MTDAGNPLDVLVVGGGQAALATAYFLRRTQLEFALLDAENGPGGAWRHGWDSLRLFSPAQWSSIAGRLMPDVADGYPRRDDVIAYLADYERHYRLPVERPVIVESVQHDGECFVVSSADRQWRARAVVSATGTWSHPFIPKYPGQESYRGRQVHSAHYQSPADFAGRRVLVVGGGNSGAQVLAEVSRVAVSTWVTLSSPVFLADEVDGRVLFERATERWKAQMEGREIGVPVGGLGDVVMVPPVRDARQRGVLHAVGPFSRFTATGVVWDDGREEAIDAVIWCTGFRPALAHLKPLGVLESDGRVLVEGTRSVERPGLWLVGYGEWTGVASATLIGVTRSARSTAAEVLAFVGDLAARNS